MSNTSNESLLCRLITRIFYDPNLLITTFITAFMTFGLILPTIRKCCRSNVEGISTENCGFTVKSLIVSTAYKGF